MLIFSRLATCNLYAVHLDINDARQAARDRLPINCFNAWLFFELTGSGLRIGMVKSDGVAIG